MKTQNPAKVIASFVAAFGYAVFGAENELPADNHLKPAQEPTAETRQIDAKAIEAGKQVYISFCLACHGDEDTQIDSPSNLFDNKWYQDSGFSSIEKTIREGVIEKGMPGWGQMIPDQDIESVIAYLASFQITQANERKQ